MMSAFIKMDNIEKYYESSGNVTKAIDRISFEIKEGEFIGIMGESGSGKTSLLNILGTVDTATAGHIYFDGKDITKMSEDERAEFRKQNLGFVFQNFNLLDMLTIQENIYIPLLLTGKKGTDVMQKTDKIMEILEIKAIANKYPYQVSGGQQQRCACARALVNNSRLILADEPTGSVALVQHYPKIIPVMLLSRSTRISDMTERQSVRFSSRVRESYMLLKSACNILSTAEKSGGVSSGASSGICCRAAVYIW